VDRLDRFCLLFRGLDRAYGKYELQDLARGGPKQRGFATTVKEKLTRDLYEGHLAGTQGLGVVPIRDDSTCLWGCIDVDVYDLDLNKLEEKVRETPLVLCRSKSGGGHLFTFFSEPISAEIVKEKLSEMAAGLGYGTSEIFPKQSFIHADKGDTGNWLNLPYFGGESSTRYALKDGVRLSLDEFLDYVESKICSIDTFSEFKILDDALGEEAIPHGPPCLQILIKLGFPEGARNKGLYNLGVYLKKAFPDDWKLRLESYNHRFMKPPLESQEVLVAIKSLERKEYNFKCSEDPIAPHCDRARCVKRRFGVRSGSGETYNDSDMPVLGGLTKLNSNPPQWFIDCEGHRLGPLDTLDLFEQDKFKKSCINQANIYPPKVRDAKWRQLMQDLLSTQSIIEMPSDASPEGMLWEYLEQFCVGRAQCEEWDELPISSKPYTDRAEKRTYFRLKSFRDFLSRQRFRDLSSQKIPAILKELGAESRQVKIRGRKIDVWAVDAFEEPEFPLTPPKVQGPKF
jgi:hypothetical protein